MAMAKFEYEIYTVAWGHGADTSPIVEQLNKRGDEGWELVGTTRDESPADVHDEEVVMFVFKREKKKTKDKDKAKDKEKKKDKDKDKDKDKKKDKASKKEAQA
jgi:hypothetical protein